MSSLTKEDVAILTGHFSPNEHEFIRGFTYITESAVTSRIEEVDPAWTFIIQDTHQRNEQIVVTARLTIKGVSRDGVGMAAINISGSKETGEPEKSAATDALKRAARLFGIGRYLLDTPTWVKTVDDIASWLNKFNGNRPSPPTQPAPAPSQNGAHEPAPANDHQPAMLMLGDLIDSPDLAQHIPQVDHRRATVNLLAKNGLFAKCETTPDMLKIVMMYIKERAKGTPQEKPADKAVDALKRSLIQYDDIPA